MPTITAEPQWLRASPTGRADIGVDREKAVLCGYVIAQEGSFKSEGRGAFDLKSLQALRALMNKKGSQGLKSRFTHPTLSGDGLGKFLGRSHSPRIEPLQVVRDGEKVLVNALRGDLHFDKTALEEPPGGGKPYGVYVMDLAESDPDALSSSIVLKFNAEEQLDPKTKKPMLDGAGNPLPPIWRPTELHASDIVDIGDAVDGLLSAELGVDGLPDELVRRASELLSKAFPGAGRDVVKARVESWLSKYLAYRFGEEDEPETQPVVGTKLAVLRERLKLQGHK
jgi:hypothetical protein